MLSEGAAIANPVLEEVFGDKKDQLNAQKVRFQFFPRIHPSRILLPQGSCQKCGLTPTEANDLARVRKMEAAGVSTNKPRGYYSMQMAHPVQLSPSPPPSHQPPTSS